MWNATNITGVNRARTCCQSRNAISFWRLTVYEVKSTCLRSQLSSASRLMLFPNLAYNWTFKSPRTSCIDVTRPSRALISSCKASCGHQNISMKTKTNTQQARNTSANWKSAKQKMLKTFEKIFFIHLKTISNHFLFFIISSPITRSLMVLH